MAGSLSVGCYSGYGQLRGSRRAIYGGYGTRLGAVASRGAPICLLATSNFRLREIGTTLRSDAIPYSTAVGGYVRGGCDGDVGTCANCSSLACSICIPCSTCRGTFSAYIKVNTVGLRNRRVLSRSIRCARGSNRALSRRFRGVANTGHAAMEIIDTLLLLLVITNIMFKASTVVGFVGRFFKWFNVQF